jgi:CDP-diacylglycerol--serine O-phosphatidyltransferase
LVDSLADVASFGVAPAVLVHAVATGGSIEAGTPFAIAAIAIPALYVSMAIVRLGFYMLEDGDRAETEGVQTTLAATMLAVAHLAGVADPVVIVGSTAAFTYLMVAPVTYPDLYARDSLILGGLQALAISLPTAANRVFPRSLLIFAVAYLVLAPLVYWRDTGA